MLRTEYKPDSKIHYPQAIGHYTVSVERCKRYLKNIKVFFAVDYYRTKGKTYCSNNHDQDHGNQAC